MSELAYKRTNVYEVADEKLMKDIFSYAEGYKTFLDEISGSLHALPESAPYPGRTPRHFRLRREREARAALLREQMKQAVLAEDFETAALLRDQIHTLKAQNA